MKKTCKTMKKTCNGIFGKYWHVVCRLGSSAHMWNKDEHKETWGCPDHVLVRIASIRVFFRRHPLCPTNSPLVKQVRKSGGVAPGLCSWWSWSSLAWPVIRDEIPRWTQWRNPFCVMISWWDGLSKPPYWEWEKCPKKHRKMCQNGLNFGSKWECCVP